MKLYLHPHYHPLPALISLSQPSLALIFKIKRDHVLYSLKLRELSESAFVLPLACGGVRRRFQSPRSAHSRLTTREWGTAWATPFPLLSSARGGGGGRTRR